MWAELEVDAAVLVHGFELDSCCYYGMCRITAPPCKDGYELYEMNYPIWIIRCMRNEEGTRLINGEAYAIA